jgi:hypothetical protein
MPGGNSGCRRGLGSAIRRRRSLLIGHGSPSRYLHAHRTSGRYGRCIPVLDGVSLVKPPLHAGRHSRTCRRPPWGWVPCRDPISTPSAQRRGSYGRRGGRSSSGCAPVGLVHPPAHRVHPLPVPASPAAPRSGQTRPPYQHSTPTASTGDHSHDIQRALSSHARAAARTRLSRRRARSTEAAGDPARPSPYVRSGSPSRLRCLPSVPAKNVGVRTPALSTSSSPHVRDPVVRTRQRLCVARPAQYLWDASVRGQTRGASRRQQGLTPTT